MIPFSNTTKKNLLFVLKLAVVFAAFYFIYNQISNNSKLDWSKFQSLVLDKTTFSTLFIVLLFSFANRYLEILKWKNLVMVIQGISTNEASKQVLGALTLAIFTPNGLGEYAGKALFYKKEQAKTIVFLNLICNGIQMFYTVFFGLFALLFLGYWKWFFILLLIFLLFFIVLFVSKKITIKGYSIEKLVTKINQIPRYIHKKNSILALLRYFVFSHQYYILFLIFEVNLPYLTLISTIFVVYFLASSLPSFQFLDFAVKGSVAVFFFGKLGINEWIVVFISTLMWFLNVVLPVVIGSFYVLKFRLNHSKE